MSMTSDNMNLTFGFTYVHVRDTVTYDIRIHVRQMSNVIEILISAVCEIFVCVCSVDLVRDTNTSAQTHSFIAQIVQTIDVIEPPDTLAVLFFLVRISSKRSS